jgi:type II secretory ATPase GspE/PulE/Tfp pilus assembly ATPase PilB-like protein
MIMADSYIVRCWHCMTEFDAVLAADCSHSTPTKICPFCLKCFCNATDEYKKKYVKNCPRDLLTEYNAARDSLYLKIGEILVKAGKISIEQLGTALDKQRIVNKKLGEVLIMMSLITPDELQLYLLNQKSIEKIDLKNISVDSGLIFQIGKEFCLDQKIVPIEIQEIAGGQVLRFAFYSVNDLPKLKKRGELQKFKLIPYLAQKEEIENLLKNLENTEKDIKIFTSLESAKYVRVLNSLVKSAVQARVSDVFFEFKSGQLDIFFRNGEALSRVTQPIDDPKEFFEKIKEICGFKHEDNQSPRESWLNMSKNFNHLKIKVLYYSGGAQENIRFKFNNLKDFSKKIAELNLERDEVERIQSALQKPNGLFIVAGPAYNKASETLYALMNTLTNERLATVESDVVMRNERFFQIENQGGDVSDAVYKNLLFYKPDSMFLFDYFQKNFNRQFLDFVEMGKLFIELQGFSYEEIFEKMQVEYDVPPSFLVENLRLVLFQRQVKILCSHCKTPHPQSARELFKNKKLSSDYQIFQEKGCPECRSSGSSRDEIFYEIFTIDNQERARFQKSHLAALDQKISEIGNLTIAQKVLNRVLKGEVSYKESTRFF